MKNDEVKRILISRTDSLGDVMLTLPSIAALKEHLPNVKIVFLCKRYTAELIEHYSLVDELVISDELEQLSPFEQIERVRELRLDAVVHVFPKKWIAQLMKKAKVPVRIGTSHRIFHWLTCTDLPSFTRKKSPLHEAQLNFKLLSYFGINEVPSWEFLHSTTTYFQAKNADLPNELHDLLNQKYVILHPKSQGSALEWPLEKYVQLCDDLLESGFTVLFTGTQKEGDIFRDKLPEHKKCIDTTGKLSLTQLIRVIASADALVACSTGPLHIAGFCGIKAVGLYSSRKPIHPGRWKPLGEYAQALVFDESCVSCSTEKQCLCITQISKEKVLECILNG